MKKYVIFILLAGFSFAVQAQKLDRSIRPEPGPAPEIKLGKTESFTLSNGLKVFVVENHSLPTFAASIQLDIRPALEGDMAGYRSMMSELLLSGTKTRSKEQLNKEIDFMGADISVSDKGINSSGLTKHMERVFELMADIAMNAKISGEDLEKTKTRMLSNLEVAENEPDAMLENVSAVMNYGKQHPYGEVATKETVKNIDLKTVQNYVETYFRPNVAYMAVVGDVTVAGVKPLIEKYFGSWAKANVPVTEYKEQSAPREARVIFVPREGSVQSVINVTYPIELHPGSPNTISSRVANSILGGGSNGRLFLNLREKHGWTYGSYSSIRSDELRGEFSAYSKGRNDVTDSSIHEILAEMEKMRTEPVSQEVLENHLTYMTGSFAIALESPATVAQYAINIERYNMPKDYYRNYLKNLNAVSSQDVMEVSKQYIRPNAAYITVVGSKSDVLESLKRFDADGEIEYFDAFGNKINPEQTPEVPEGVTSADVMAKYIAALGGKHAIESIQNIRITYEGEMQGAKLKFVELKQLPAKMKIQVSANGMTVQEVVFNGNKGYQIMQGQRVDMTEDEIVTTRAEADIQVGLHPEKYGISRELSGMESSDGENMYKIMARTKNGDETIEYYSVETGLLRKEIKVMETPQGNISMTTEYSDYKEVPGGNGYKIPYSIKIPLGPGMSIAASVQSVEVNQDIPDNAFE